MQSDAPLIVYGPTRSKSFFSLVLESAKDIPNGYGLGLQLAKRDIKAMYRQSILGLAWAVFTPVAQTLVWVFLSNRGVLNVGDSGVPYAAFVLSGIMMWQTFVECMNAPLLMFNNSRSILSKVNIIKESLIVAGYLKSVFNLAIKLVVLFPVLIYFEVGLSWETLLAIPLILSVMVLGFVIGIWMVPVGVLFTDVQRAVQTFIQLLFFLTPIIYPPRIEGVFGLMDKLNPAAIIIGTCRDVLVGREVLDWSAFGVMMSVVVVFGLIGLGIYRVSLPIIIERMGS